MSIHTRNKKHVIDYRPHGKSGRRVRVTLPAGTTRQEAEQIEKGLRKRGRSAPEVPAEALISNQYKHYINHCTLRQAPRTVKDKESCYKNHILPYFGGFRVRELTSTHIEMYQKQRKAAAAGNRTVIKEIHYFFSFVTWARKTLKIMPPMPLTVDHLPYRPPKPHVLTRAEAERFIQAADPGYRPLFLALFHLGIRINEAQTLTWDNVDLPGLSVIVRGKGNKERILPLSRRLAIALQGHRAGNQSRWVFPSPVRPSQAITNVRKAIARARERAGITKKVHPHLFRHSLATLLIAEGVDIRIVQQILGHEQISTTEKYTQIALDLKRSAMTRAGFDGPHDPPELAAEKVDTSGHLPGSAL